MPYKTSWSFLSISLFTFVQVDYKTFDKNTDNDVFIMIKKLVNIIIIPQNVLRNVSIQDLVQRTEELDLCLRGIGTLSEDHRQFPVSTLKGT